jgi:hypothetical protein
MRLFQATCLASAVGGAIAGSISCYAYGLVWVLGGLLLGGFGGVLSFLVLTSLCALLVHVTGTKSAGEKKNSVQQAIVGITLGITVLSPFVSVAAAIGIMAVLKNLFN